MKELFIVNRYEFEVGKVYTKADFRKFKKASSFQEAVFHLTYTKNMIVFIDITTEDKTSTYYIREELDAQKIFNDSEISPDLKYYYFMNIKNIVGEDISQRISEHALKFFNNCLDLNLSIKLINDFRDIDYNLYIKHLTNIINNDTTGYYLRNITSFKYDADVYANAVLRKMIDCAHNTKDTNYLLNFLYLVSISKDSTVYHEVNFYEILDLVEEYDTFGKNYFDLNQIIPFFEVKFISEKIVELAHENKNAICCVLFLDNLQRHDSTFSLYKSIDLESVMDAIIQYWNDDSSTYFINDILLKNLSANTLERLRNLNNNKVEEMVNNLMLQAI